MVDGMVGRDARCVALHKPLVSAFYQDNGQPSAVYSCNLIYFSAMSFAEQFQ